MKHIVKGASPEDFERWKAENQFTNWDSFPGKLPPEDRREEGVTYYSKIELREALLEEQGYTCCYCEKEISNDHKTTAIEHIEPREGDTQTERIFDYLNLILSCNGGEKDPPPKELHCDAAKSNKSIPFSPLDKRCKHEITFTINGKILGLTEDATQTIKVLNLDIIKLKNARKDAISGYIYEDKDETELISIEECNSLIINLQQNKKLPFKSAILRALHQIKGVSS